MTTIQYFKLRYTPLGEFEQKARSFFRSVLPIENLTSLVFGFEENDKCGKPTHPHYHCHFSLDAEKYPKVNIGSLRKKIQRFLKDSADERKGNAVYSLCHEDDVKDEKRFFRYPFKQGGRVFLNWEILPEEFDLVMELALAREEYDRMVEDNLKKLDKMLRPNTKDKLFQYLDECKITPETPKVKVLELILYYYTREEMSANRQTIMGYLNTSVLRYGIETIEQMAEDWLR